MATIYKIEIKTVSPFMNFTTDHVEEIFTNFIKNYQHKQSGGRLESTEIKVTKE